MSTTVLNRVKTEHGTYIEFSFLKEFVIIIESIYLWSFPLGITFVFVTVLQH